MTSTNVDACKIEGYNMEFKHRTTKTQGGVAVYINNKIQYKNRADLSVFHEGKMETCFVELLTEKQQNNIIIGEIYRVPNTDETFFLEDGCMRMFTMTTSSHHWTLRSLHNTELRLSCNFNNIIR